MALPENFDPLNMSMEGTPDSNREVSPNNISLVNIPRSNIHSGSQERTTNYIYSYRKSLWQRFDDFITDIGDWFAKNIDDAPDIVAFILAGIYVIGALAMIIYTWINEGFGWAILAFVISVALGYVGLIAIGIVNLICRFIMGALRLYFYSGASFLIVNILIFSCLGLFMADKNFSSKVKAKTEISAPATIEYICTANEFINIRVSPNTKANVLGRVKRGESVQVYEIKNGFAKVKWGSGYGYANAKYIKKKY